MESQKNRLFSLAILQGEMRKKGKAALNRWMQSIGKKIEAGWKELSNCPQIMLRSTNADWTVLVVCN